MAARPVRVWAPRARQVDLSHGEGRTPMVPEAGGWWTATLPGGHGTRYGFCLDGGPVRPDPRSGWQPDGVHRPSALVDTGSFDWHDQQWRGVPLRGAVLYELHVGTFSPAGTFDGVVERVDHLV